MTQNIAFPVIDMRATGENIRKLREQNGMKVRDLQEIFGFTSPMSIYKWQEGKTLPDYTNLLLLTDLWNVRVEDILVRENRDIFSFFSVSEMKIPHKSRILFGSI
jgi:transcriptional regulator with XRE-family HTH domain